MTEIGTVLSVAQTLFAALQCSELKDACSAWDYESQLEDLKSTVITVQSVLIDAGNKIALSQADLNYIKKLKDAVYDADDLFDKFITLAERKKQNGNLSDKVRYFFSSENPIKVAYSIFGDVNKIRNHLNAIADDHTKFGFSVDTLPLRRRREETCSYVYAQDVVGRDGDASKVIQRLLDSNDDIGFLTIVGIGGMGKTTLAKLVLGDERIKPEFNLRLWVCVSDQDGSSLDIKEILTNILASAGFRIDNSRSTTIEYVQSEYQRNLEGKKFLLILDDVWTESLFEWNKLREFLMIGGKGSRIVATTRSKETAKIIGNDAHTNIHELESLSRENSCLLFQMAAFQNRSKPFDYVDISEKIIEKCCDLPLAIKVVGSLLYGQPIGKWEVFEKNGFAGISNGKNEVMSILKFSYDYLEPSLKSCFAYCAIFPKDYVIDKEKLISLWEAQGYIVPFDKDQSIENAGEEHFSILLKRCFFQDVKKNEYGDVVSFKIHDLMHDLAQKVTENEICVTNSTMTPKDYNIARHIFEVRHNFGDDYHIKSKIRSCLFKLYSVSGAVSKIAKNCVCLRALELGYQRNIILSDTLGNLLHLRYLNLSNNPNIQKLPDSIAKLYNLRTLNLNDCRSLEIWPKDFSNLVNLKHLYIHNCISLRYMPVGISKLSTLHVVTDFILKDESTSGKKHVGQLEDIKAFAANLKGDIIIRFCQNFKSAEGYDWVDSCLENAGNLNQLEIHDEGMTYVEGVKGGAMLERLKPHPNLKEFVLTDYKGEKIQGWGRAQDDWSNSLPNLIHIKLGGCHRLQQLPVLSKLKHLKTLCLLNLKELEYIEEEATSSSCSLGSLVSSEHEITFFPSLEFLIIFGLPKLKGWWTSGNNNMHCQFGFPRLSELNIIGCDKLTSFPPCPSLETLDSDCEDHLQTQIIGSSSSFSHP